MKKYWWAIPAVFLMVLSGSRSLRADTINQTLASTSVASLGTTTWFPSYFNPADGTLTSVAVQISGSLSWTPSLGGDTLDVSLDWPGGTLFNIQSFQAVTADTSQQVNVNISETFTRATDLAFWTGTGFPPVGVTLESLAGATLTGNLSGSVVYTYTPVAAPEPSTALLLLIGLAAVVLARKRFAGGADATA